MPTMNFNRYFLLALVIAVSGLFFWMIRAYLQPVLLAAILATLVAPLYRRLLKLFRGRRGLASASCCVLLVLGLILPMAWVGEMVRQEAVSFYDLFQDDIKALFADGGQGLLGRVKAWPLFERLGLDRLDGQAVFEKAAEAAGTAATWLINKTSAGTVHFVWVGFITLFTLFYFLIDGPRLVQYVKDAIPLDPRYEDALIARFISVTSATVKGTLVIAMLQGLVGGLTLWICGIPSPILWTVVMVILSIIPVLGVGLVMYPAAMLQLFTGHVWQGVVILVVTTVVTINLDNVLRPRLVGHEAGMHDLMVFFSTLGGLTMFGFAGFVIGPVVAAFFQALIEIYVQEFKVRPGDTILVVSD